MPGLPTVLSGSVSLDRRDDDSFSPFVSRRILLVTYLGAIRCEDYFCRSPGFVGSAGDWFVEKKVKVVGHDTQANDHPLATAIGPQRNGPLHPHLAEEYKEWSGGRDWKDDFPEWEPVHRKLFSNGILGIENVGGDLDKVTGRRCTFAFFPWNWDRGDGCIIRLVAMVDPKGAYRIESGEKFA